MIALQTLTTVVFIEDAHVDVTTDVCLNPISRGCNSRGNLEKYEPARLSLGEGGPGV